MFLSGRMLCRGYQSFRTGDRNAYFIIANSNLNINTPCQYFSGEQIEKNETGGTCSKYGGGERCIQGFGGGT